MTLNKGSWDPKPRVTEHLGYKLKVFEGKPEPQTLKGKVAPSGENPELPTSAAHKPAVARRQASETFRV